MKRNTKPISLNPLCVDEAVSDLLKIKPAPKVGKKEGKAKRTAKQK